MNYEHFHTARGALAIRTATPKAFERPGLIRWVALIALVALLLVLAQKASAQPTYSPQVAAERHEAVRSVIMTNQCMFDATTVMTRLGERSRPALEEFAFKTCKVRMRAFLVGVAGFKEDESDVFIRGLAQKAVEASLSWGTELR